MKYSSATWYACQHEMCSINSMWLQITRNRTKSWKLERSSLTSNQLEEWSNWVYVHHQSSLYELSLFNMEKHSIQLQWSCDSTTLNLEKKKIHKNLHSTQLVRPHLNFLIQFAIRADNTCTQGLLYELLPSLQWKRSTLDMKRRHTST